RPGPSRASSSRVEQPEPGSRRNRRLRRSAGRRDRMSGGRRPGNAAGHTGSFGVSVVAFVALFSWPLVAVLLFRWLPPRRAVAATMIAGWLFLPVASFDLEHLPPYSKPLAAAGSALFGTLLFDRERLWSARPRYIDLPIAIVCLSPFATSLANHLGPYDGVS